MEPPIDLDFLDQQEFEAIESLVSHRYHEIEAEQQGTLISIKGALSESMINRLKEILNTSGAGPTRVVNLLENH